MITDTLQSKIIEAMKAKDEIAVSTLKMLSSALSYDKIAKQHDLTEEEELAVVRIEAKKRRDAIEAYTKANLPDRAEKEKSELAILEAYLPAQMDESELSKIVDEVVAQTNATSMADMGKVIGAVMAKTKGMADGSRVSGLVKAKLSK